MDKDMLTNKSDWKLEIFTCNCVSFPVEIELVTIRVWGRISLKMRQSLRGKKVVLKTNN